MKVFWLVIIVNSSPYEMMGDIDHYHDDYKKIHIGKLMSIQLAYCMSGGKKSVEKKSFTLQVLNCCSVEAAA